MDDTGEQLVFRGRKDQQIKLRGFRVELGEVEAKVAALDGVDAAAVVVIDEGSAARLIAFIVAPITMSRGDVLRLLSESLPYYMLPSDIIQTSSVPKTSNGKIDRSALRLLAELPKEEVAP